jgi:hypothetical protein
VFPVGDNDVMEQARFRTREAVAVDDMTRQGNGIVLQELDQHQHRRNDRQEDVDGQQ